MLYRYFVSVFEETVRRHATYSPEELCLAPTEEILDVATLEPLSSGYQSRVYRVRDEPWVIKEGRWDCVPMHAELAERALKNVSFSFLPRKEFIAKQYRDYLIALTYLGYFVDGKEDDEPYYHPKIEEIRRNQVKNRAALQHFHRILEDRYNLYLPDDAMEEMLSSAMLRRSFVPKEYLLYGKSIAPENKGKETFFIVQQYVEGIPLHDVAIEALTIERKRELGLFLYLILFLRHETGLIPDTRPRYPLTQAMQWLLKTDNIIVGAEGLSFIDTRWFWNQNDSFVQRGLFIPEWTHYLTKKTLSTVLSSLMTSATRA